jgi:hypothetical protein
MTPRLDEKWIFNSLMAGQDFSAKIKRITEIFDEYSMTVKPQYSGLAVVGTDLDRTMVYSQNSMQVEEGLKDDLLFKVVEMYEKRPLSYMTSPAYINLEIINSHAHLVPVTTRTEKQFKRIKIPGTTKADFASDRKQYAVTTNGANILVNGVVDPEWAAQIQAGFEGDVGTVEEVHRFLKQYKKSSWVKDYRNADGFFLYMVIDRAEAPEHTLKEIRSTIDAFNWSTSLQGRKIYFVPNFINKGAAFAEIVKRVNGDYSIGCGDSLLDIPLMEAADISIRPSHGELEDVGYTADNNVTTKHSGIFAGEEITARILAQVYSGN